MTSAHNLQMFHIHLYIECIRFVRNDKLMHPLTPTIQTIIQVVLFTIIVPHVCVSWADVLNDSGISFLCQFGSLYIFRKFPTTL